MFSDSINKSALNFSAERKSLPRIKIPNLGYKSVCFKCDCMITRDSFADKHLSCLPESKKVSAELLEKLSDLSGQTPLFEQTTGISNLEAVAYQRVILNLVEELEDALFWKAKYDCLCKDESLYEQMKEIADPEQPEYDIASENKREAKIVNLDRATLEKARKTKLP